MVPQTAGLTDSANSEALPGGSEHKQKQNMNSRENLDGPKRILGRGFTSCLLCDKICESFVTNNADIIMGVKLLFAGTDQVNFIMSEINFSPANLMRLLLLVSVQHHVAELIYLHQVRGKVASDLRIQLDICECPTQSFRWS